jgi:hypothetical protein
MIFIPHIIRTIFLLPPHVSRTTFISLLPSCPALSLVDLYRAALAELRTPL